MQREKLRLTWHAHLLEQRPNFVVK